jgi:hypothetical protein
MVFLPNKGGTSPTDPHVHRNVESGACESDDRVARQCGRPSDVQPSFDDSRREYGLFESEVN